MKKPVNVGKESIPIYSRIESLIRNKIVSGRLEPGERLPTEEELARQFGVSRITVRTALFRLEIEGLIERSPGKGTYVADQIPVKKQFILTGGLHDIVLDAQKYEVKPLGIETTTVSEARYARDVRSFLGLGMSDTISVVRRVRLLKSTPIYYLENFIPEDLAKHLTEDELSRMPLLKVLKQKIGLVVSRGEMYIEAVPAEVDVAAILDSQIFEPLILVTVYYWLKSGEPMEVVNCFMRPEYFKYKVDIDAKDFESI